MKTRLSLLAGIVLFFACPCTPLLQAGPLTEARVNKIINDVVVLDPTAGAHPAALQEVIKEQIGLKTGIKSRSELLFQDNTLTRIGPESFFSFKPGTREMALERGTMLLQVPKGIGGAKIRTAAVTASITGTTIMMEYHPNKSIKVLVLEGSLRLSVNGTVGDSLLLLPGKMVIMHPNDRRIPDPISVDLATVVKTSSLVKMSGKNEPALPSMGLIDHEIDLQASQKDGKHLINTNLVILGGGTNVVMAPDDVIETLDKKKDPMLLVLNGGGSGNGNGAGGGNGGNGNGGPAPTPLPTATPGPTANPTATPAPTATPSATPAPTATPSATPAPTATPSATPVSTATPPVPTPTPIAQRTPYPTPNPAATVPPRPITTLNPPPVSNGNVLITNSTGITSKYPKLTNSWSTYNGAFYEGAVDDGPASWWAFGSSSTYDAQRLFDSRFGMNGDQAFPALGVATFRFASIGISGAPNFNTSNGPTDLALVSNSVIYEPFWTAAYSWSLNELTSLTFVGNGGISLDNATFNATVGSQFKFLHFYERSGGMFFNSDVNAPTAGLFLDSAQYLNITGSSSITVDHLVMNAGSTVNFDGIFSGNLLQIYAGGAVQLKKKINAPTTLNIFAPSLTSTQGIAANGGILQIGSGGIDLSGNNLLGLDNIITTGDIAAINISASNQISAGGAIIGSGGTGIYNLSAFSIAAGGGLNYAGSGGGAGATVNLSASSLLFDSTAGGINGVNMNGGNGFLFGGDGGTLNVGSTAAPIAGDVTINKAINATTGANGSSLLVGGTGGTVNVTSNGTVAVSSTLKVSESAGSARSARGGKIAITSNKTSGSAINVRSSAQLLALLSTAAPGPAGSIKLTSAGGDIDMSGTARADRGTVEITNTGNNGVVNVSNATLHGDAVKVGALGNNGTLNVGGGSISGDSTIKLYAGGSNGTVNFTDNVTLSGNSLKTIAANTVNIFNGKVVTVNGLSPANVFTNNPNYTGFGGNGSTTGTFGGLGATTQPLSAGPPGY